jgi:hypothetical protein
MKEPETPAEWHDAVVWAETLLTLDAAKQYGLLTGGPRIDVARCQDLKTRGNAAGYFATNGDIDSCIHALIEELHANPATLRRPNHD